MWAPSGAPIWSTPAIDAKLNVVYVTTGDNYSEPGTGTSDAFIAIDMKSGKKLWIRQMTANDAYTSACRLPDRTNCPDVNGPDFDFGASPILVTLRNGKRALIAGQKSGIVHALDPDKRGEKLWDVRVGKGGTMGGVQWGSAADGANVYVANSDIKRIMLDYATTTDTDASQGGGMYALKLENGERIWYTPPPGLRRPQALQPGAIGGRDRHAGSGVLRFRGRASARLFRHERRDHLGLRYDPRLSNG